jgi:hypothetical protein
MIRSGFGIGVMFRTVIGFLLLTCLLASCGQAVLCFDWQKCLGGSDDDQAYSVEQTSDGGYVVAGRTVSNNRDVSGNHGRADVWVVRLESSGNLVWQRCIGGSNDDGALSVQQTSDGGYVLAGGTKSDNGGDVSGNHGSLDAWILKLDFSGNLVWQRCLGGSYNDYGQCIQPTADGGCIAVGYTASNDGDVTGNHGRADFWIVRLDPSGNLIWQRCLGGGDDEVANSVQQTSDGGYILAGHTRSNDGNVSGNHGSMDCWIVKLDPSGNLIWQRCLGGRYEDSALCIQPTSDGGYIFAGFTESEDGDVSGNHGGADVWVVKLDPSGNLVWQRCLDRASAMILPASGRPRRAGISSQAPLYPTAAM